MINITYSCDYCKALIPHAPAEVSVQVPPEAGSFRGLSARLHFCDRSCLAGNLLKMGRELMVGNARNIPPDPQKGP